MSCIGYKIATWLIIPLPLYGTRHALFLNNEVPGIHISETMQLRLRDAGDNAPQEGVRLALELIAEMKPWASGVYLMPQFGRYDLAAEIIEGLRAQFRP